MSVLSSQLTSLLTSAFSLELNLSVPDWNTVSQINVLGEDYLEDDASIMLPTSGGALQISLYNYDALGVNAEVSYKNIPFIWSQSGQSAFVHTPAPITQAVGYAPWSQQAYNLLIEDDTSDIFYLKEKGQCHND